MRRLNSLAAAFVTLTSVVRADGPATQPATSAESSAFRSALQPAAKAGGFAMPGYFIWCSSVIKVGDTYHLFASRWPSAMGMSGWTTASECVRATSKNLLGPYEFQEVVLAKRPASWDNSRVHNGKVVRVGNQFVLYYINSANQTGYAYADAITGPWTRSDAAVIPASNPAPLVKPDGSVYVFCRKKDEAGVNRGIAYTSPTFRGPYTLLQHGDNLLPDGGELEDPTIWLAGGRINVLLNDWKGHATGTVKAGAEYSSADGLDYRLASKQPVFGKTVTFDDGSTETFARRERPFVFVNDAGEITALFTACLPTGKGAESRIVAQPVDRYVPGH